MGRCLVPAESVNIKMLFICCIVITGLFITLMIKGTRSHIHEVMTKSFIAYARNVNSVVPTIYVITPTYYRLEQKAELTRMTNTLLHVHNLHWIVVEDSDEKTKLVTYFLATCGVINTHLNISTPKEYRMKGRTVSRGVLQRNAGLDWIRRNLDPAADKGVVYFADDDNTYSLKLFEEMRYTKRVSIWPVGIVGGLKHESPIVENGTVTGWRASFRPDRAFAIDMAGFAVNINVILNQTQTNFSYYMVPGTLETSFLTALGTKMKDLEPKADGCTKVLVWHTRTERNGISKAEVAMEKKYNLTQFADMGI